MLLWAWEKNHWFEPELLANLRQKSTILLFWHLFAVWTQFPLFTLESWKFRPIAMSYIVIQGEGKIINVYFLPQPWGVYSGDWAKTYSPSPALSMKWDSLLQITHLAFHLTLFCKWGWVAAQSTSNPPLNELTDHTLFMIILIAWGWIICVYRRPA